MRQGLSTVHLLFSVACLLRFFCQVSCFSHASREKKTSCVSDSIHNRQSLIQILPNKKSSPKRDVRASEETSLLQSPVNRRDVFQHTSAALFWGALPSSVVSNDQVTGEANLGCLLDLPPVATDRVRVYLCRHGQTDNNRLRRVQGAREDPPINQNGLAMAKNVGMAFARLEKDCPSIILHSQMLRAKETAQIASQQVPTNYHLQCMESLGEVDFGPMFEGKQVSQVRTEMVRLYGAWAAGFVDTRPEGGGESGREVLNRTAEALSSAAQIASENGGSVIAVSHSTYSRMLLAAMLDTPLAQAATFAQANGCINVIDLDPSEQQTLGHKSNLFGGTSWQAPNDFELCIPRGEVVRLNEHRHLEGITTM